MPVVMERPTDKKLEVAQAYLAKCESELASLAGNTEYHPGTKLIMHKDLASEITAWKAVIVKLTPKEESHA